MIKINKISDQFLYDLCRKYGEEALTARRKFTGLLPEVYKRQLYKKKGFFSIYEFAAKLAGLSHEQVDRVLRLERKFEKTPVLREALVRGEVSVNKLVRVASIASAENQEELCEKAKILPKSALETFVRDVKREDQNGLFKGDTIRESVPGHTLTSIVEEKFSEELKGKLEELSKKGIDINDLLLELLKKREIEIAQEKERISSEINEGEKATAPSRYIPAKIKKVIKKEFGDKCSVPGCCKSSTALHHTRHFSMVPSHDPQFLAPLCNDHHKIAHLKDITFARRRDRQV